MNKTNANQNVDVKSKFEAYPEEVRKKMKYLRSLIFETASEIGNVETLEETLKWGEPSYIAKKGSTIRMDWKEKNPDQYAMYFNCNTSLVETFKSVFGGLFKYEKNRAILFDMNDEIPKKELKECIELALKYHSLKHKPFLGK